MKELKLRDRGYSEQRSPTLNTVLMVEETLMNSKEVLTIPELKRTLPKQIMHQTLMKVLDYLEHRGRIELKDDKILLGSPKSKSTISFEINRLDILDIQGNVNKEMPKLTSNQIKELYKWMLLTRIFDQKALNLQRQGRFGVYASQLGQEASVIGSSFALNQNDWLVPSFRESGGMLLKGYPMDLLMRAWSGDERGNLIDKKLRILPVCIPVATQTLHATGVAWAMKKRKENSAVIVYFGDGATSEGDFYEAMNFASVFKVPVVFFCQNNQYAISLPRSKQSVAQTLAQKSIAFGFKGIQVDGNDIFAVYKATKEALDNARKGNGPTLIESFTYRREDHTTSDSAVKYRDEKEVKEWEKKDPIDRLEKYMIKNKLLTNKEELIKKLNNEVEEAVVKAEAAKEQTPSEMFMYNYAELDEDLKKQLEEFKNG